MNKTPMAEKPLSACITYIILCTHYLIRPPLTATITFYDEPVELSCEGIRPINGYSQDMPRILRSWRPSLRIFLRRGGSDEGEFTDFNSYTGETLVSSCNLEASSRFCLGRTIIRFIRYACSSVCFLCALTSCA